MLDQIAIFLAAAVFIVPLFKKAGLGTVIGYLAAGILIGPWGLRLVTDVESILHFSEFGVVLLLFIIGLELQPSRLWVLRRSVFGLGSAQVALTTLLAALGAWLLGLGHPAALIIGAGFAMSSTAFVLQTLAERNELTTRHGREAFSILLFQDLAVIPMLALMPLLAGGAQSTMPATDWFEVLRGLVVVVLMVGLGRQLLRLLFGVVARFGSREIFTAAALLVVIGTALLMNRVGLSMPLGAFIAGVLMADSEFRHELEAELEPFKGLLLGLFFIAVGMSVNLGLVLKIPWELAGMVLALLAVKFAALYAISRVNSANTDTARNLGIAMAGGGEFAFVLFALARRQQLIDSGIVDILMVVVTLSLIAAPFLFLLNDKVLSRWAERKAEPEYDKIDEPGNPVIIFGFGRVGQIISRILHMRGIKFTALESNPTQVDFVRKLGSRIYYGDATRLDLMRSAKVESAKLCVLAINNVEVSIRVAEMLRKHYPDIPVYARAHNRLHCYKLMDLKVDVVYRDTFYSSLMLARSILEGLDFPKAEAERTVNMFREHDEMLLKRQHVIYQDEEALIESALKSRAELQSLFESDDAERVQGRKWAG
ncbi:MAG: glutathione-regulated potassium-efflux system protein KefB [Gammaproteobacteria bacterium RIFCSPLOWO2_02_FULL_61_13]|nr:MAG: glutathione-regulated potassium-efflux system protein KefB [Gammaproteobacteria bacterium RIFCSPLOWO2_02_FULL_61_13]